MYMQCDIYLEHRKRKSLSIIQYMLHMKQNNINIIILCKGLKFVIPASKLISNLWH